MGRYQVSGVALSSDAELPELPEAPEGGDAWVSAVEVLLEGGAAGATSSLSWFREATFPDGEVWLRCARTPSGYLLEFAGLASFLVSADGRRIVRCNGQPSLPAQTIRHLVIDQVLPHAMSLFGRQSLHATAVLTAAGVCAFMGPAGAGKSTLAASFEQAGYRVFCDDCLSLDEGVRLSVWPGYPGVRLWEDSLRAVGRAPEASAPVAHYAPKYRPSGRIGQPNFPAGPVPLARLYRLEREPAGNPKRRGAPVRIEPMREREAFMELVSSSFLLDTTDQAALKANFETVKRVLAEVGVRRLRMPNGFEHLPAVRRAILADLTKG